MKIPIALRLLLAVLLTAMIVAATGLLLLQAGLQKGFDHYLAEVEVTRLDALAASLQTEYQRAGAWPNIPDAERRDWLRHAFIPPHRPPMPGVHQAVPEFGAPPPEAEDMSRHDGPPPDDLPGPPAGPPPEPPHHHRHGPFPPPEHLGLPERVGLVDAGSHYLAGQQPVADTPRRALTVNGKTIGYLTVAPARAPDDALSQAFLADQARNLLLIGLACVLLSALAAALLASHFRRPIGRLVDAAQELTRGHFAVRLDIRRSDELGTLAQTFNHLAIILEQHERSRRQWVADTSHELRTPVAVLRAQIEALQDGVRSANPPMLAAMQRQAVALGKLIDDLYELARSDVGQLSYRMEPLNITELVMQEAEDYRDRLCAAGLRLRLDTPLLPLHRLGDADRLRQVVSNLLQNSLRYTYAGGEVVISTQVDDREWRLHVDDTAPGVPAEALVHLGERFFRLDPSRSREHGGSGLGLALCQRIAEAHGGGLRFAPSPLGGLRVTLFLPLGAS